MNPDVLAQPNQYKSNIFDCMPKDFPGPFPTLAAPPTNNPKFNRLLEEMGNLHNKKNFDYSRSDDPYSNFKEAAKAAGCDVDTVFRVLIGIKIARLNELLSSGKTPNNESIQDSRMDLTMYCALWTSYHLEK